MALPAITVNGTARISPTMPARKPPSAVTTSTTSGWMSSVRPITFGSTKFSRSRFEASTTRSMIAAAQAAVAERDDHRQPTAEERADVGDVAADEVHHDDREHQREAEEQAGDARPPRQRSPTSRYGPARSRGGSRTRP